MTFRHPITAIVCLAGPLLSALPAGAQAPAATLDVQLMQRGEQLAAEGKYADAAAAYDEMVKKFPQMPQVPEANFRAGYNYYLAGNYDNAIAAFKRVLDNKNLPAELAQLAELSLSMTPQVLASKAAKLPPEDPQRKPTLEEAVKQFDAYLTKYPNSDEAESATYGKALSLFQLADYESSIAALRGNLTKFAKSPTIQDSQYLLALTLATLASNAKQKETTKDTTADGQFDESEKILRDIIASRQNLALMNDSQFQIGELLLSRGGFMGEDEKARQDEIYGRALDGYRSVVTKDVVVAAQKQRIAYFTNLRNQSGIAKDLAGFQRNKRIVDKETEKLAAIEGSADKTVTAKFKTGVIFFSQAKWDETRVLYTQLENLGIIDDAEEKKQMLYFVTMSYAAQNVVDKAVAKYDAFQGAYKADPIAQNLQLLMGAMFLSDKVKQPEKAIQYFNEGVQIYPQGKALSNLVLARAGAQIELEKFDDAKTALKDVLAKKPTKELAVSAEFYLGTIELRTGKKAEALAIYKTVRDKYPDTHEAEQANFQVGQLQSELDPKAALPELESFLKKYPKSTLVPAAMMALGKAEAAAGQQETALTTLKKLATEYPKSEAAPFSYFERGTIYASQQKYDDTVNVMKDFIAQYPDSKDLFQAYDFIAQIQTSGGKGDEAIKTYDEFVEKRPTEDNAAAALLKVSALWKGYAEKQGVYIVLDEAKRTEWKKGVEKSSEAAEKLVSNFPESPQVAQGLSNLLEVQKLQISAKLKSEADIEKYFEDLSKKFSDKPSTQAKVLFTLATYTFEKDKAKALQQMAAVYKPDLKFAAEDLDLYGQALLENKKIDESIKVYQKIGEDNPLKGDPKTAAREIQEAQAIMLAGEAKALQEKGDPASKEKAGKLFAELEATYPWSPKMLEVNYGIASTLHDEKKDDDAMKRIFEVIKAQKASSELRAKSMLLLGKIHEANGRYEMAIDNFMKISVLYLGVPKIAAEGLWLAGQLLEKQARGEIPMPTPTPKPVATPAPKKK